MWAPNGRTLDVHTSDGVHPLERDDEGVFERELSRRRRRRVPARRSTAPRPIPTRARASSRTASAGRPQVVDPGAFEWTDAEWQGVALDELVVYELHVGTFSEEGTFDGVIPRLAALRELGVTAIELMPVATFPGERGWGYDGLYTYAPHPAYGGPDGLARLVDAAHADGLGVILDVVYNHVGPGDEALRAFGSVLHDRSTRPSGATRSTTRSPACASGRSRTRSSGCATTTSTACGSTRCTRSSTTRRCTSAPSSPSACAP